MTMSEFRSMPKPKVAVLDGDIIAYKAAAWADIEGIDDLENRLRDDLVRWTPEGVSKVIVSFSCTREENFRRDFWPSYKAHRDGAHRPDCLGYAKELLSSMAVTKEMPTLEADDIMGMAASSGAAIAVTIDKDLRGVPGWHFNPDKDMEAWWLSSHCADEFFAEQIVAGDSTDNIPGLYKKGKKFFEKEILPFDREDWMREIWWAYEEAGNTMEYFLSQARCVRILRIDDYDNKNGVLLWTPEFAL